MTDITNVDYTFYNGGGDIYSWIDSSCSEVGIDSNDSWRNGLYLLCQRESSLKPNAVNTKDLNATGPVVSDGNPQNCSRGLAQCIPETFAKYHADGTAWQIYNPVANIAAAVNYILEHYGVSQDGSDLAKKVQQADPNRKPRGYKLEVPLDLPLPDPSV